MEIHSQTSSPLQKVIEAMSHLVGQEPAMTSQREWARLYVGFTKLTLMFTPVLSGHLMFTGQA